MSNTDPFFPLLEIKQEPVPIIIVIGRICSGKDTFAQGLAEHNQIDVGDIVREITQTQVRVQKSELDIYIIPILIDRIKESRPVVVTGLRQISILNALIKAFSHTDFEFILLNTSEEERRARFFNRGAQKDTLSFEECEVRDKAIGLDELIEQLPAITAAIGTELIEIDN